MSSAGQDHQTAVTLYRQGRRSDALRLCQEILRAKPGHWPSLLVMGQIHLDQGRPQMALPCLIRAAQSGAAPALSAVSRALEAAGRPAEAERMARAAICAAPHRAEWWFNLGNLLQIRHCPDEADRAYRRALAIAPNMIPAHFNRATALLRAGRMAEAWPEYEWRWRRPGAPQHFHTAAPQWRGDPYDGHTLLVHSEQGLGDAIQFARFLPTVAALAGASGRLVVECPPPLLRLFRGSFPTMTFVPKGRGKVDPTPVPPFDRQAALASLPGILGVTLETVPAAVPYMRVPENGPTPPFDLGEGPSIGVIWAGSSNFKGRDLPLTDLLQALTIPGARCVSLQVGPHAETLRTLPAEQRAGVLDAGAWIEVEGSDFAATAAVMQRLDLMVSVDTATAHLAGALGRPLLVVLPHLPDWRWMLGRADSPWYPTATLIRQQEPGDWSSVLDQVRAAVDDLVRRGSL